ncbi:MAG: hypothetical protein AAF492_14880 [Verrucomicrobiota bacterium]
MKAERNVPERNLPRLIDVLFGLLLLCPMMEAGAADESRESGLARLIEQLGAEERADRNRAERTIRQRLEEESIYSILSDALDEEGDPEMVFRLRRILNQHHVRRVFFSGKQLEEGRWTFVNKPTAATFEIEDQMVAYDSTPVMQEQFVLIHRHAGDTRTHRLVFEADVKILKENHLDDRFGGVHMTLEDKVGSAPLMIREDDLAIYHTRIRHPVKTTDGWHRYRIVAEKGQYRVYMDDMEKPVISAAWRPVAHFKPRSWVTFGDSTAKGSSIAEFRNISFSISKPK